MKGVYVLVLSVSKNIRVKVGRLGTVVFRRGIYAYVGSAQTNLEKRIARHLRKSKKTFWHIDYLLGSKHVEVAQVFWKKAGDVEECATAKKAGDMAVPIMGFGCSDCSCRSHLFMLSGLDSSGSSRALLTENSKRSMQREFAGFLGFNNYITPLIPE